MKQALDTLDTSAKKIELHRGMLSPEINASDLPSGVYIYKINAGNYTAVKKMILLK